MLVIYLANKKTHGSSGVYVGRPSVLQNIFFKERERQRQKVINEFEEWIESQLDHGNYEIESELERIKAIILQQGWVRLVCWCSPKRCHSEIIARILARNLIADGYEVRIEYMQ